MTGGCAHTDLPTREEELLTAFRGARAAFSHRHTAATGSSAERCEITSILALLLEAITSRVS